MTTSLAPLLPGTPTPPAKAAVAPDIPDVTTLLLAIAGLLVFGGSVGLSAPSLSSFTATTLLPVAGVLGAAVLTGPALVAGQLFLHPQVGVELPVAALARGVTAAGSIAAGMAPLALFLVATSGLWPVVLLIGFAAAGIACAVVAVRMLTCALGGRGFVLGWLVLATLIALRIAFAVGSMVLEGAR